MDYAHGGNDYETTHGFAYYRHISDVTLNLASYPIKVSTERWEQRKTRETEGEKREREKRERRSKSKDSTGRKEKMKKKKKKKKNQPNLNQDVLSTFPREGPVRVINESHRQENRHSSLLHHRVVAARCACIDLDA